MKNGSHDTDHAARWFVILRLGYDIVYLRTKFDDLASANPEISLGAAKF